MVERSRSCRRALQTIPATSFRVIAFALEQEVDFYAPAFRGPREAADPIIRYREPSETPVDRNKSTMRLLADERRCQAWRPKPVTG